MKRDESGITNFCEIFDTVVELTSGTLRSANHDAHTDTSCESVEYPKECFRLVIRAVFVYGHKDVLVAENRSHAE